MEIFLLTKSLPTLQMHMQVERVNVLIYKVPEFSTSPKIESNSRWLIASCVSC